MLTSHHHSWSCWWCGMQNADSGARAPDSHGAPYCLSASISFLLCCNPRASSVTQHLSRGVTKMWKQYEVQEFTAQQVFRCTRLSKAEAAPPLIPAALVPSAEVSTCLGSESLGRDRSLCQVPDAATSLSWYISISVLSQQESRAWLFTSFPPYSGT